MILDPLESRDITSLTDEGDTLEVGEVVFVDVFAFRIVFADGSDGSWTGIQVID